MKSITCDYRHDSCSSATSINSMTIRGRQDLFRRFSQIQSFIDQAMSYTIHVIVQQNKGA
jgi:hypothetical protein